MEAPLLFRAGIGIRRLKEGWRTVEANVARCFEPIEDHRKRQS